MRLPAKRRSKYGSIRTELDGFTFDSKKEARRWADLRLLEKAGEIHGLERQVPFPIYVCRRKNGELHEAFRYVADFKYREGKNGLLVIEDAKGVRTAIYRLKRKAFELQYDIRIRET